MSTEKKIIKEEAVKQETEGERLKDFLSQDANREHAEEQCTKLWYLLTEGEEIEFSQNRVFKSSTVTNKTNLSHKTAQSLFELLRAFGLLTFVKGTHQFTLNFEPERVHKTIEKEVLAMAETLNSDIIRYKASLDADEGLTEEKRLELWNGLISKLISALPYEAQ